MVARNLSFVSRPTYSECTRCVDAYLVDRCLVLLVQMLVVGACCIEGACYVEHSIIIQRNIKYRRMN